MRGGGPDSVIGPCAIFDNFAVLPDPVKFAAAGKNMPDLMLGAVGVGITPPVELLLYRAFCRVGKVTQTTNVVEGTPLGKSV